MVLAQVYALTGRREQALALMSVPPFAGTSVHASMFAANGRREEALAIVKQLEQKPSPVDVYSIASVFLLLGDTDRGFEMDAASRQRPCRLRAMDERAPRLRPVAQRSEIRRAGAADRHADKQLTESPPVDW
jgi:hypothetical protein